MANWRRRDLERRSGQRSRRIGALLRADVLLPLLSLVVAGLALWQALAAKSRADLLSHELSVATSRLRSVEGYGPAAPAPLVRPTGEEGDVSSPPLPPLAPVAPSGSGAPP